MITPSTTASRRSGPTPFFERFADYGAVVSLLIGLLLLMGEEVHLFLPYRLTFVIAGTLLLVFTAFAFFRPIDVRTDPRVLVSLPIVCLTAWAIASVGRAEFRSPALADLLRMLSGAAAFALCAFGIAPRRLPLAALGLVGIAVGVAVADLAHFGATGALIEGMGVGFYATHEEVGTLLLLVLPLAAAVALTPDVPERWRVTGYAVSLFLAVALIVEKCRSAWVGGIAALLALALLLIAVPWIDRKGLSAKPARQKTIAPLIRFLNTPLPYIVIGLACLPLIVGRVGGVATLRHRFVSLGQIPNGNSEQTGLTDRFIRWEAASRMAAERSLVGWGLGSYFPLEARWSHRGFDTVVALTHGADHGNIAHDYYVQWAAETGGAGLFLHVAAVIAVLLTIGACSVTMGNRGRGKSARDRESNALLRAVAIGAAATLCGAFVDALGSPSYQFPALYGMFWAVAGIGVAAMSTFSGDKPSRPRKITVIALAIGVAVGLTSAVGVIAYGRSRIDRGRNVARGVFRLDADQTEVAPGETLMLLARYTDAAGQAGDTGPGTVWSVACGDPMFGTEAQMRLENVRLATGEHASLFSVYFPATNSPVRISAQYRDAYSRVYEMSRIISVRPKPFHP